MQRIHRLQAIGREVELTIWDSPSGSYTIPLEDWQVDAIQQVLGLRTDFDNGAVVAFTRAEVEKHMRNS